MKTAADGDDYTWCGAVLNAEQTREVLAGQTVTLAIDLHTPDQKMRELASEVQRLRELVELTTAPVDVALRVDNLVDALEMLTRRVTQLERSLATLRLSLEQIFEIRL